MATGLASLPFVPWNGVNLMPLIIDFDPIVDHEVGRILISVVFGIHVAFELARESEEEGHALCVDGGAGRGGAEVDRDDVLIEQRIFAVV